MNLAALRQQRRLAAQLSAVLTRTAELHARLTRLEAIYGQQNRADDLAWSGPAPTALRAVEGGVRTVTAGVVLRVR